MDTPVRPVFEQLESQVRSYSRAFPSVFEHASGAELIDNQGNRYIDFLSGCGSLNYGHNNPVLKRALIEYIKSDSITHSMDMHTTAKGQFLETFHSCVLKPRSLDYVVHFTGPTGTNAVEAALKVARKVSGRTNVISFTNAFHGVSLGSLALTGNSLNRHAAGLTLQGATTMPFDGYFGESIDTTVYLEKLLSDPSSGIDEPAAIIVESVQGEGGLNTASVGWLKNLERICRERDIILILDEIQTGCGRTGTFFGFEEAGIKPDLVTMAKSLSGYGLPMAVLLIKRELDILEPGEHNGTFRGNNHAFATATSALEHYWSDGEFAKNVKATGNRLRDSLNRMMSNYPLDILEVRGRGMMYGLRLADPRRALSVCARAFRSGLILERSGPRDEVIKFLTPLTITHEVLDEGIAILSDALAREFATLRESNTPFLAGTVS